MAWQLCYQVCEDAVHVFAIGNDENDWLGTLSTQRPRKDKYVGNYNRHDQKHGYGKQLYANGNIYHGQWSNGMKHGHGVQTWSNGETYEGEWKRDERHGSGKQVYDVKKNYNNGTSIIIFYDGQWVHDKKHGRGVQSWSNGDTYNGEYQNNQQHGHGICVLANGTIYHDGEWQFNKPIKEDASLHFHGNTMMSMS
jgi:hypothetical protein